MLAQEQPWSEGQLIAGVFNVDPAQAHQSSAKLTELDFEVACFGHGRPLGLDASLAFRRAAERLGGRLQPAATARSPRLPNTWGMVPTMAHDANGKGCMGSPGRVHELSPSFAAW